MGDPKKQRKKFDTPRFRWRKDVLQEELKLLGQFGLRNKHELWRTKLPCPKTEVLPVHSSASLLKNEQRWKTNCWPN
jgi:hypothetical protein